METQEPDDVSSALVAIVEEYFSPAESYQDSTSRLTTAELFTIIERHAPNTFFPGQVQPAMKHLGYRTAMIGEDIRWLVRAR
jgi:hypothetical protein